MKADIRWLDNPEIFRVNREDAHSDHAYYASYNDMEKKSDRWVMPVSYSHLDVYKRQR